MGKILLALAVLASTSAPLCAGSAFQSLLDNSIGASSIPVPEAIPARADGSMDMDQFLPPDSNEPGFDWPGGNKGLEEHFIYIGKEATHIKASGAEPGSLSDGSGKCALAPNTLYRTAAKPGFDGEHMTVVLAAPLAGCQLGSGFVYMSHVSSSSAGGAWQLPRDVRAFLDTLAYAEGTGDNYNYIFTHATFRFYADHPRARKCSGKLCSNAAGRYQFLSKTWDGLAPGLGLTDFTPPSQEKAVVELIRRGGAYRNVSRSHVYENFTEALRKLNGIWASLPGSPYGQPTHSTASLWKFYKASLAKY